MRIVSTVGGFGLVGVFALLLGLAGCEAPEPVPEADLPSGPDRAALSQQARGIFGALPPEAASEANPDTPAKIELGRKLYYETRLSKNHDVSCNSCHSLVDYGVDGAPTSTGHRGQRGGRNSPTVYNAAFHTAQFWDGRAADVEAQAKGPVLNPIEMAMPSEEAVVAMLESIPEYGPLFRAAFPDGPDPITYDHMAQAIGAFERRLVTPSRFDRFQAGDLEALSDTEVEGLMLFVSTGCISCHNRGPIGGTTYQKIGVVHPYPTDDAGRFEVTGAESDRSVFKVPSLRNIDQTGPYFHDGAVATLDEAVRLMAYHQLGRELSDDETALIVAFLRSLTGTIDSEYVAMPALPASGPETPAPDPS
jgi:cytochrome c peroxidase